MKMIHKCWAVTLVLLFGTPLSMAQNKIEKELAEHIQRLPHEIREEIVLQTLLSRIKEAQSLEDANNILLQYRGNKAVDALINRSEELSKYLAEKLHGPEDATDNLIKLVVPYGYSDKPPIDEIVFKVLLKEGANVNVPYNNDNSVLDVARNPKTRKLLREAGATPMYRRHPSSWTHEISNNTGIPLGVRIRENKDNGFIYFNNIIRPDIGRLENLNSIAQNRGGPTPQGGLRYTVINPTTGEEIKKYVVPATSNIIKLEKNDHTGAIELRHGTGEIGKR